MQWFDHLHVEFKSTLVPCSTRADAAELRSPVGRAEFAGAESGAPFAVGILVVRPRP
jgi:hypothetical protein